MTKYYDDNRRIIFRVFTVACLIAIITCVIVNGAIDNQITWSAYSILSIPLGWLVISPLLIKKYGIPLSLCSITLFVSPYLFLLEKITPVNNWFAPVGLPSAAAGIITMWVFYILFRFLRISLWYKSAIAVFLLGAAVSPVINHYVSAFLNETPTLFHRLINIFPLIVLSALLWLAGYRRKRSVPAM